MQPKRSEVVSAIALFLFLVTLIVAIVFVSIPPGGPPTLH